MIDISVSNLVKEFQVGEPVLDGVSFQIDSGERVGLLGKNGAGKTTLFKILTGELDYDEGEVMVAPDRRIGLISQIPVYPPEYTVEDVLETAFARLHDIARELKKVSGEMAGEAPGSELYRKYDALTAALEAGGGYDTDTRKNKICSGLSISPEMRTQHFEELSGGEKTRINLGRLILEDTDILLLDEPTNHLDLHATQWLESYLDGFKGTVLAISHDRYFLDRVVKRIIELDHGKAEFYSGSYSFFVREREARYLERQKQYEKEQAKIAQLQAAADKLHLWAFLGNDKLHKRAFSMEKRIDRMHTTDKPTRETRLDVHFAEKEFRGDEVLTAKNLEKRYGDRTLFSGVNLEVTGGERIALIGDNGTGKSTLLKLIMKQETPDAGKLRLGPTVKIGYLPQIVTFEHPEWNILETMIGELRCTPQSARNRLAAFQFKGEDVFKAVSALSGGERSRLRLCMLMDGEINLLILDEPTNHLDIISREWIEQAVEEYEGNLLFVSHDRYFISRFAQRIWELEGGAIHDFRGSFEEYCAAKEAPPAPAPANVAPAKEKREKAPRTGGTKPLEKQLSALEREIAARETEKTQTEDEMEAFGADYQRLQELCARQQELETALDGLYGRWEELSSALEEARR